MNRRAAFAFLAAACAAIDLLAKHWAFGRIGPGDPPLVVIEGTLVLHRAWNTGIVFGLFPSAGPLFLVVAIAAVPAIAVAFLRGRDRSRIETAAFGLILGGAAGNAFDRAAFGAVRDFITFFWAPGRPWHTFNPADSFICAGVALLAAGMLFSAQHAPDPQPPA